MIRFLLNVAANLVLAVIAFLVADLLLDDVAVKPLGFLIAVVVFALAQGLLAPAITSVANRYASALVSVVGLVSTFLALWVATLVSDGITVTGIGWVLAPLIIWLITAFGGWILNALVIKRILKNREAKRTLRKQQ